jgi:hypothetical protein
MEKGSLSDELSCKKRLFSQVTTDFEPREAFLSHGCQFCNCDPVCSCQDSGDEDEEEEQSSLG